MAQSGWMTALQAALGGVAGGLEGYSKVKEQEKLDEERKRAEQRQQMMDALTLSEKGYVEQGARNAQLSTAAPSVMNLAKSGIGALMGNLPSDVGAGPQDMQQASKAAGLYGAPVSSLRVGDKTYEKMQTPLQETMMKSTQEQERSSQADKDKLNMQLSQRHSLDTENQSIVSKALAEGASVADKSAAISRGLLTPQQVGFESVADKRARAMNERKALAETKALELRSQREEREDKLAAAKIAKMESDAAKKGPFTPEERKQLRDYENVSRMMSDAIAALEANPDAFGEVVGTLGRGAFLYEGKDAKKNQAARSAVENAVGQIRRSMFGVAITRTEANASGNMFPSSKDQHFIAIEKLKQLYKKAEIERSTLLEQGGLGYKPYYPKLLPADFGQPVNADAVGTTATPSAPSSFQDALKKSRAGGTP